MRQLSPLGMYGWIGTSGKILSTALRRRRTAAQRLSKNGSLYKSAICPQSIQRDAFCARCAGGRRFTGILVWKLYDDSHDTQQGNNGPMNGIFRPALTCKESHPPPRHPQTNEAIVKFQNIDHGGNKKLQSLRK